MPGQKHNGDNQQFPKRVDQLGDVVSDIDQEIEWWLERGVGPWLKLGPETIDHTEYLGKPVKPRVGLAFSQIGGVQLEMIQPFNDQPSPYRDFLASGKSRFHHCAFYVASDYQKVLADSVAAGEEVQMKMWFGGAQYTYLSLRMPMDPLSQEIHMDGVDQRKNAAVREWIASSSQQVCHIAELIEFKPMIRWLFGKVTEAAVDWDGKTEPVRRIMPPALEKAAAAQQKLDSFVRWFKER